jgi:hypothetical protein
MIASVIVPDDKVLVQIFIVSMTPVINLSPVSTTPARINRNHRQ